MIDLHYDLLTYIYLNVKRGNMRFIKDYCEKIFDNNINGGILNLYFMSKKDMKKELGINENELNVINMLKVVVTAINEYDLLPNRERFLFGIEGCDYLKSPEDLIELYNLGVRSIAPVWNEVNKYGSGINGKDNMGLTASGEDLITKAVKLGIMIDLSHTNNETFWDIIELIDKLTLAGYNPFVFASHSNCRNVEQELIGKADIKNIEKTLFYKRNLDDVQLLAIKKRNGLVGLVAHKTLSKLTLDVSQVMAKNNDIFYIKALEKQFLYLKDLFGSVDNIGVATDDLSLLVEYNCFYHINANHFSLDKVSNNIKNLLKNIGYSDDDIKKVLHVNYEEKILSRMN